MMQTSTATPASTAGGCGCGGCGGAAAPSAAAFVRPNFFAGQLLTEDDLQALTGYVTGKNRLSNRMLLGPGVVCGLEVVCDPCGGGTVTVQPGYALDCCGNDVVVDCPARVDVNALVRDLRIRSLGVDCGDDCGADGTDGRRYGLYVRYTEVPTEPVAPYPTDDGCSSTGCSPSRIREAYTFSVKGPAANDHHYVPSVFLTARLGDPTGPLATVRLTDQYLARYEAPLTYTVQAAAQTVTFDDTATTQLQARLTDLQNALPAEGGQIPGQDVPHVTELVRALAASVARYQVSDKPGSVAQTVDSAVAVLRDAYGRLQGSATVANWGDEVRAALAQAVLDETNARLLGGDTDPAPLEMRMLAQGAPLSYPLRRTITTALSQERQWLLDRFDAVGGLANCVTRSAVAGVTLPPALPPQPTGDRLHPSATELTTMAAAIGTLHTALLTFLSDSACASLHPPAATCADTDLLLAVLTVANCTVVDICTTDREQVLPGGSAYAAWLPTLYTASALAATVCCQPVTAPLTAPSDPLPYVPNLFDPATATDLDTLLAMLYATQPPALTPPSPGRAGASDATQRELAELRARVAVLTEAVTALQPESQTEPSTADNPTADQSTEDSSGAGEAQPDAGETGSRPAKATPAKSTPQQRGGRGGRGGSTAQGG